MGEKLLEEWTYKGQTGQIGSVIMFAYLASFPDTRRQYEDFQKGPASARASVPFGFYVKEQPKNKEKIILEKSIDAKDTSPAPQYIEYGDFKLKIEHVEPPAKPPAP